MTRLSVEARCMEVAFAYEMAAVAVSNIQPFPHQLEAVHDCLLPSDSTRRYREPLQAQVHGAETLAAALLNELEETARHPRRRR